LGIRFIGKNTAKILASEVKCLKDLTEFSFEKLIEIKDIGPKVAESIQAFFSKSESVELIAELESLGLKVCHDTSELKDESDGFLKDKTFVFTGGLENFSREEATEEVEKRGGKVVSSVSKNLNYLVLGDKPGSKLQKAQALGTVSIIDETGFRELLNSN
jgi:DNA ligase (NAD+)